MAGHSKWANIQHRKSAQDAKRGKLFTKLIREITVAARLGGPDPSGNPRLRAAVEAAASANMSKEVIERAMRRGAGETSAEQLEEVRYEGYGPGGVAVLVDCLTDNRHRTASEVRHAFAKAGGSLGTEGSVAYLFTKCGVLSFPEATDEERLLEAALAAGALDVVSDGEAGIEVLTAPHELGAVKDALLAAGLVPQRAEVTMRASTSVAVQGEQAERTLRLLELLEDLDDVQRVYCNAEISDEVLAKTSA